MVERYVYTVTLKVRPLWQRICLVPWLTWKHHRIGVPWREAFRVACVVLKNYAHV